MTKPLRLPTPLTLADEQTREALQDCEIDYSEFPVLPWRTLGEYVGPLLPGHLVTIGARPANGKTEVARNILNAFVRQGMPCLYFCTETPAKVMWRTWAAMTVNARRGHTLANRWGEAIPGLDAAGAKALVRHQVEYLRDKFHDLAVFVDLPVMSGETLKAAMDEYARRCGYRFVIIDHIHRYDPRSPKDLTSELGRAVRRIKGYANDHGLSIIVAAQVNRPPRDTNPLIEFLCPPRSSLQQTAALEQESNVIVMLHRQKRAGVTPVDIKAVLDGEKEIRDLIEPGVMCCTVSKNRDWPEYEGRMAKLEVPERGVLREYGTPPLDTDERYGI